MTEPVLVSTSDIAELVDERLPVVSTWRSRFKTGDNAFPEPVGGSPSRPLFDLGDVRDWVSRNRPEKDLAARLLPIQVWSAVRELSDQGLDQFDLVYWVHLLLHARKCAIAARPASTTIPIPAPEAPLGGPASSVHAEAFGTVESLIEAADSGDLVPVSDFTLTRLTSGYGRGGGDTGAVDSPIARILGAAAHAVAAAWSGRRELRREAVVYDPACGIGESLIQTHAALGRFGHHARLAGTEINDRVAVIASIRLVLRDIEADIDIADALGTALRDDIHPDLVVVEPPLGQKWAGVWTPGDLRGRFGVPSAATADLAWVVDAAARLEGEARGFVLTSFGALSRGGVEERVRAALVRSGAVESIIALPPKLLQYTSIPLALWVLRAPSGDDANRLVELVDATDPQPVGGEGLDRSEWVKDNIASWVISPLEADPNDGVLTAAPHFNDLIDARMDLTPSRWTAEPGIEGLGEALFRAQTFLAGEVLDFPSEAPNFAGLPAAADVVTVRDLTDDLEAREAKLWTGRGVSNDEAPPETITSRDIGQRRIRPGVPKIEDRSGFWTAPGDIVFTTMSTVRSLVDVDGGHRIGSGVHVIRLLENSRFVPEYVAMCLSAKWNQRLLRGSTIKHARPGDLEIPLLPLAEQRAWLAQMTKVVDLVASAETLMEWASDVAESAENFLRFGRGEATEF